MGRIFISAGHGGTEGGIIDPGVIAGGTTEAKEMILTRDLVVPELRSRGFEVLSVPDELSAVQTIAWINARALSGDAALEINAGGSSNPSTRGSAVYYIANNDQRKAQAELLLLALLRRVPQLQSRGTKPDTASGLGSLAFCRRVIPASLFMEIGLLTSPEDRALIQNSRRDIALGIADGLASWSRIVSPGLPAIYPTIDININGGIYDEKGILVNGNAYIPIDLADQLAVDLTSIPEVRRITYRNIIYVKAIELRDFGISITWDSVTRTVILRNLLVCPGQVDQIMGKGSTSEVQLMMFLKANNENALTQFPDIPKLYREEGTIESVNYDIAFCQMCVETGFLRFGGDVKPEQNNFGGLGTTQEGVSGASFPSARVGVRAHIQHLKAYASTAPLVQELVDPRFNFVKRGVAPLVDQLTGRWAVDPDYGTKILALVKRLYESSGLTSVR